MQWYTKTSIQYYQHPTHRYCKYSPRDPARRMDRSRHPGFKSRIGSHRIPATYITTTI
jgi:hypothetical protein